VVITDLGVLRPDHRSNELVLVALHPGVDLEQVREQTGWDLAVSDELIVTDPPTDEELDILHDLQERTQRAHSG
jgi:glutaconate CoA-transferase subunit B